MKILNVAEKPSVAKSISHLMSQSVTKIQSCNKYTPNHKFTYKNNEMTFTSLLGHLFTTDFVGYQDWNACDPAVLFEAEIRKYVNKDQETIKRNIQTQMYAKNMICIWTDCDREGENIAKEIHDIVREKNKQIMIKRARFSAITYASITQAFDNLTEINMNEAEAVDTRIELDLRIGSAFTRLQSLNIDKKMVLSYGSCQIPTLGFVVQRILEIDNFVPEKYYDLELHVQKRDTQATDVFAWTRSSVYDKNMVIHMQTLLSKSKYCTITAKNTKEVQKTKPLPLRTVELQKACASYYKISSAETMKIAESLYTKGYISYPRTETDVFSAKFDYKETIKLCKQDERYKQYCDKLNNGRFAHPRKGKNDDMAHSPIYPLKNGAGLTGNDSKIYDFVARRFLACVSRNATGNEICVEAQLAQENFAIHGLKVTEQNYLEIYTYEKWNEKQINDYTVNTNIELRKNEQQNNNIQKGTKREFGCDERYAAKLHIEDKETAKPTHLTEPELIALMDKNGIGTDATIAEHIQKIQDRKYAYKRNMYIIATSLGYGLIDGYKRIGLTDLPEPHLRCKLEADLKRICDAKTTKQAVIDAELAVYMQFYDILSNNIAAIQNAIQQHKDNTNDDNDDANDNKRTKKNKKDASSKNTKKTAKQKKDDMYADFENVLHKKHNAKEDTQKENTNHIKAIKSIQKIQKPVTSNKLCHCNKEIKINTVTKSGVNKDKEFYSCSNWPSGCEYFEWVTAANARVTQTVQKCYCGFDVQQKKANTEQNKDRIFYCCKKAYKPCKYFAWQE